LRRARLRTDGASIEHFGAHVPALDPKLAVIRARARLKESVSGRRGQAVSLKPSVQMTETTDAVVSVAATFYQTKF
jgi:hypothetical protein